MEGLGLELESRWKGCPALITYTEVPLSKAFYPNGLMKAPHFSGSDSGYDQKINFTANQCNFKKQKNN